MRRLLSRVVKGYGPVFWIQHKLNPTQFVIFSAILIG